MFENSTSKDVRDILNKFGPEALRNSLENLDDDFQDDESQPEPQADSGKKEKPSSIVRGVNNFPVDTPIEQVILGKGWIRWGDIATFISTAGAGKSVAMAQAAMAWGLGLPYLGITPPRPLRIIHFSGEDDEATLGQNREGFLKHSEAITGRQLTAADLAPLDEMLRTDFSREHCGIAFHPHLEGLLNDEPADLVIINPLFSYIGGDVVPLITDFARVHLMPLLGRHNCAALIAHHTTRMGKDSWDNIDDTYSAIGGSEIANIPRSVLTLRPTASPELSVVTVSKRKTTGWRDSDGNFTDRFFVQRTDNPERPAWIPVDHDEAQELIAEAKPAGKDKGAGRKASPEKVVEIFTDSFPEVARQHLIARTMNLCGCGDRTARTAISEAEELGLIEAIEKPTGRGGRDAKFYRLKATQSDLPNQ